MGSIALEQKTVVAAEKLMASMPGALPIAPPHFLSETVRLHHCALSPACPRSHGGLLVDTSSLQGALWLYDLQWALNQGRILAQA